MDFAPIDGIAGEPIEIRGGDEPDVRDRHPGYVQVAQDIDEARARWEIALRVIGIELKDTVDAGRERALDLRVHIPIATTLVENQVFVVNVNAWLEGGQLPAAAHDGVNLNQPLTDVAHDVC
jgi:hypothetical protein